MVRSGGVGLGQLGLGSVVSKWSRSPGNDQNNETLDAANCFILIENT